MKLSITTQQRLLSILWVHVCLLACIFSLYLFQGGTEGLAAFLQVTSASAFSAPHCKGSLLPRISFGLARGCLQQMCCQKSPDCVLEYSVPFLLSLSCSQGPLIFQGCQTKICSPDSLCFLVCVFILIVPQTVQRCRRFIGWMCCFVPEKILIMHFTRFPGRMSLVVASRNEIHSEGTWSKYLK